VRQLSVAPSPHQSGRCSHGPPDWRAAARLRRSIPLGLTAQLVEHIAHMIEHVQFLQMSFWTMWGSKSQSSHGTSSKFTATKSPSCAPESKKHPDQITIRTLGAKRKLGKTRGLNIQPPQATSSTVQITSSPWVSRSLEMMGSSWDQSPGPLPSCGSLCGLGSFAGHQLTIRPLPLVWIKVGWAACTSMHKISKNGMLERGIVHTGWQVPEKCATSDRMARSDLAFHKSSKTH